VKMCLIPPAPCKPSSSSPTRHEIAMINKGNLQGRWITSTVLLFTTYLSYVSGSNTTQLILPTFRDEGAAVHNFG